MMSVVLLNVYVCAYVYACACAAREFAVTIFLVTVFFFVVGEGRKRPSLRVCKPFSAFLYSLLFPLGLSCLLSLLALSVPVLMRMCCRC